MLINSRKEDRRLERRLKLIRLLLALSKVVRSRYLRRVLDRLCTVGGGPSGGLEFLLPYHRGLLIFFDPHSYIEQQIFYYGYFDREVIDFLELSVKPGAGVLDVGANIGCHALVMARLVGDRGRVVAFEPHPQLCARLQANVRLNGFGNVDVLSMALSDTSGQRTLFMPRASAPNQGLASLHRDNLGAECDAATVAAATLDGVVDERRLERVDLVKIDVQGHEHRVLLGAQRTLTRFRPVLVFEFSTELWRNAGATLTDVETYLTGLGYELFVLRRSLTTSIKHGLRAECNLLAVPTRREPQ